MDQVSVLLASSHMGLRLSLQQVLENEGWIKVVGTPASEADTLNLTRTLAPHVIIIDSDLADDCLETGRRLLQTIPGATIILLGLPDDAGAGKPALWEAPVAVESIEGFSKDSSPAELMQSIAKIKRRRRLQ